jgi:hypothetical protein
MKVNILKVQTCVYATLLLFSCNREELERAHKQKDSLQTALAEKSSQAQKDEASISDFIASFNEIEQNLDSVAAHQHLVNTFVDHSRGEFRATSKDKINAQIKAINNLMDENRGAIASLQKKLKSSSSLNKKLKQTVATLETQIAKKDEELAMLNQTLNTLNLRLVRLQSTYDSLYAEHGIRTKSLEESNTALHTAYYLVARSKDLVNAGITGKHGGVLGIGRTATLNQNFDRSKFTRIDYTSTTVIPVNSEKAKIITAHPTDSYKTEGIQDKKGSIKNIVITNPEQFWSISKFLVVEGNPLPADKSLTEAGQKSGF